MPKKFLKPKVIKLFAVMTISLLLIFLNPRGIFGPVRKAFFSIAYPFQKTFYLASGSLANVLDFLSSISELKLENEKFIKENNQLAAEIALLKGVRQENDMLREQLRLAPMDKYDLEASFIIGQDPQQSGGWVLADKGSVNGIKEGMPVIAYDGILIGKISEVFSGSSKINLISDSESVVNAVDLETGSKGIVKGEYGLGILMDMVNQSDILNSGDTIVTSGLGSEMPKGFLIGKIQEIKSSPDKLFQQAIITPLIKYSKLNVVFVVKK